MQDDKARRGSARRQRLVLLALFAPLAAIGITLWFFLPGSVGGLSYTPSQFNREARLRPFYWSGRAATLQGTLTSLRCRPSHTLTLVLSDAPLPQRLAAACRPPDGSILLLPQRESGLHAALRHLVPGLLAAPVTASGGHGQHVRIAGTLQVGYSGTGPPTVRPADL